MSALPMLLTCPACGERHVDEGEWSTKLHHTHACQSCGMTWRPAVEPTVGVRFLPGFKNEADRDLKPENDTPETIEAAAKAYGACVGLCTKALVRHLERGAGESYGEMGERCARVVLTTAGYPWPETVRKLEAERDTLRAEVERLTKELATMTEVRDVWKRTSATIADLSEAAPAPCTHADLLGPVTEEEAREDFSNTCNVACREPWSKATNAMLASRPARAGEATVSKAEEDAATAAVRLELESLGLEEDEAEGLAQAALLAAAKVRAKGGA